MVVVVVVCACGGERKRNEGTARRKGEVGRKGNVCVCACVRGGKEGVGGQTKKAR